MLSTSFSSFQKSSKTVSDLGRISNQLSQDANVPPNKAIITIRNIYFFVFIFVYNLVKSLN